MRGSLLPASDQRKAIEKFVLQQETDSINILMDQQKFLGHRNRTRNPKCEDVLTDYQALAGYRIFLSDFRLFYFLRIRKVSDINCMVSQKV